MRLNLLPTLALLLAASPALAMLSPFYDSAAKIDAILQSGAVADALRQAPIGAVSNVGTDTDGADLWQVRVQECDLTVRVVGHPPKGVGMITYTVEVTEPCR
jgi:hypothetical protein